MNTERLQFFTALLILISFLLIPLNKAKATSAVTSILDTKIENIRALYAINEGWDLSLRAPSSLSSQNSFLLSQVNKRWSVHLRPQKNPTPPLEKLTQGITLKASAINDIKERHGADAIKRIKAWEQVSHVKHNLTALEKLTHVNNFFNRLVFKSDKANWGMKDYWSSPIEFLIRNAGDCEDYAIAKYLTLIKMGMDAEKLRITYVKATNLGQAHMVLAYYETLDQVPLILDNINSNILPASQRTDLSPVYSFNG